MKYVKTSKLLPYLSVFQVKSSEPPSVHYTVETEFMQVNEAGSHIVAAESGDLLYWDMATRKVVHQERQENIQQIFFYKNQARCVVVSKKGTKGRSFV